MPRSKRDTRAEQGAQFEAEVAEIYSAMGYQVSRHVPLCGQEVDILAERHIPGAGPYRVMVECKYKGGGTLAGNEDVQAIAGAYQIARNRHEVSACTLVTTNGFSLQAQQAADAAGILTATKRDLVRRLLDFSPYHRTLREEYVRDFGEGEEIWYIPTRARQGDEEIESLADFVDQWRAREEKRPLVILGGYGTGKTSFCRHYTVRLLEREEQVLPVIISLREFQKATKIESLIRDFLEEQCNAGAPRFETFWRMYQEGLLLLIFDGFDEMASRVDASVLEMNLAEIEKFARSPANVILTCRPEVFITQTEEAQALQPALDALSLRKAEYERVEMELWTPEQVGEFVRRRVSAMRPPAAHPPEFYLDRIESLPELKDMSTRAVHLDLIVRILPDMIAKGISITRTNLYRSYIEREFRRETVQNRRLRVISDEDRVALLREVAARSFLEKRDTLNFDTAAALVQQVMDPPRSEVDSLTRDLLNRSFLRRQGDVYEFAHKSLGEYLFATYIYEQIQNRNLEFLYRFDPTAAVAGMVLELFGGLPAFWEMASALEIRVGGELKARSIPALVFVTISIFDYIDDLAHSIGEPDREIADSRWDLLAPINYYIGSISAFSSMKRAEPYTHRMLPYAQKHWKYLAVLIKELLRVDIDRLTSGTIVNLHQNIVDISALVRVSSIEAERHVSLSGASVEYVGDKDLLTSIFQVISWMIEESTPESAQVDIVVKGEPAGVRVSYVAAPYPEGTFLIPRIPVAHAERCAKYHGGYLAHQLKSGTLQVEVFLPHSQPLPD